MTVAGNTIDPQEATKFAALSHRWWDREGPFKPLHILNPTRTRFIRDTVVGHLGRPTSARAPFEGLRFLDVGCGGGLLSEPMARLGASVTGVDAAEENIVAASAHAASSGLAIDYRAISAEDLLEEGARFDVVLAMEVVEHVADVELFLTTCARLVAPGGLLILATLNRTAKGFALGIVAAEYVLGWVARGTHDWRKFLTPEELAAPVRSVGLSPQAPVGVSFDPLTGAWKLSGDISVNYMLASSCPASPV
jgi:2-polyprenyl-6-hydroxyphenyl methylase / 3-demethylubiquinone-9 3-methyltransferase